MLSAALDAHLLLLLSGPDAEIARRGGQVVMRGSDGGRRWVEKFVIYLAQNAIADLDGVRCAFLCQPAEKRPCARSCVVAGRRCTDSVLVVEVGI